jgi:hypothetical protein
MTVLHRGLALADRSWRELRNALSSPRVAVQLTAVIVGAVLAGIVAVLYSGASGTWQQSIREETVRSGLRHEQVRAVYEDEAPLAIRVAAAQARAEALRGPAGRSELAAAERVVSAQLAFAIGQSAAPGSLAAGRNYALPNGGFDVSRRLADVVRAGPAVPDPERTAADGDAQAALAGGLGLLTVVVTGLAVVLAALPGVRRNPLDGEAPDSPDDEHPSPEPEIIPQPGTADPRGRRIAYVLLVFWAAGVLLPFAQLALGGEEQRYQAAAARTAVQLTGQIAIGQARAAFADDARRTAIFADAAAISRQLAALDVTGPLVAAEESIAAGEETAAARTRAVAEQMGAAPSTADGIDGHLADALASVPDDWSAGLRQQIEQADRAETFGAWSNATVAFIAAVAALGAVVQVMSTARQLDPEPQPFP